MNYQEAYFFLTTLRQEHLLNKWDELSRSQQEKLLSQISSLDTLTLKQQQELLTTPPPRRQLSPFTNYAQAGNKNDYTNGLKLIAEGKVGCLIVAGGQGSRLGFDGPKGAFPITEDHKSLFQLFAERTLEAGKQANQDLLLAIMTSPVNHSATVAFFKEHHFFGLKEQQISFFSQEMLPFLDDQGKLINAAPDTIACGPDGNGGALHSFVHSGLWQQWFDHGIRYLNFIIVDNALADPFDAELIAYHARHHSDVVIKCTKKRSAEEKVGVLAIEHGRTTVVEYSEMSPEESSAITPQGTLLYSCANISLFSFTMEFIERIATQPECRMPLHKALKKIHPSDPISKKAWKFEKFIFDVLAYTDQVDALVYPREQCFAPLKSLDGEDGVAAVQHAIHHRALLEET